jgi:hypothetical protein
LQPTKRRLEQACGVGRTRHGKDLTGGWTPEALTAIYYPDQESDEGAEPTFDATNASMNLSSIKLALGAVACALSVACVTHSPFTEEGTPNAKYLVGGGFQLEYVAPTAGTALVVERSTAKILATRSLDGGELFDFDLEMGPDDFELTLGIPMHDASIGLYFIPRKTKD